MRYRIIIPAALIAFSLAAPAFASQISGTITAGSSSSGNSGSSGQVGGTVGNSGSSGSVGGTVGNGGSSGTVSGTVANSSTSGVGGNGNPSSGSGGGSILAYGGGSPNPLPGATPSTGIIPATSVGGNGTVAGAPTTYSPNIPASTGGASLTSGSDLADSGSAIAPAAAPIYFGTNQTAAAANSGLGNLWWAIAIAAVAIILLGWLGYRELA